MLCKKIQKDRNFFLFSPRLTLKKIQNDPLLQLPNNKLGINLTTILNLEPMMYFE